jgi:hypothetical protein
MVSALKQRITQSPMTTKLVIFLLQLLPLVLWCWRRITFGPRANFSGSEIQPIENAEGSAEVRELCTKYGWPVEAWVQCDLKRSRLFELAPQGGFRFDTDLEIGVAEFDSQFFIGTESQNFIRALAARSDLRKHFVLLPIRLNRFQAKLVRVRAENRELAIQCNVRWTKERSALYLTLLLWMQELDALLAIEAKSLAPKSGVAKQ